MRGKGGRKKEGRVGGREGVKERGKMGGSEGGRKEGREGRRAREMEEIRRREGK